MSRSHSRAGGLVAFALSLAVSTGAYAALVQFTFAGTLQHASGSDPLVSSLGSGSPFTVRLTFDDTAPDTCVYTMCHVYSGPESEGLYALKSMGVDVGGASFSWIDTGGSLIVLNDAYPAPPPGSSAQLEDAFIAYGDHYFETYDLGLGRVHAAISMFDSSATAFDSTAIPQSIDLQRTPPWANALFQLDVENDALSGVTFRAYGALISFARNEVPEPGGLVPALAVLVCAAVAVRSATPAR